MRHAAFAALAFFGLAPALSHAQIVPSGPHAPNVINTANGIPQVNIQKPSGAGVSMNTYSQFDVQKNGAILNNSPVITGTQLAGQINGNSNFARNDAAKLIVNQVNSNNPSLLRGYVEVAGQKASVVIANSSGLVVDGGGFINTARGILTTGNPLIDGSGNLTGFNVTGGTITVQGAGLNASNIDQVDLLARAVQANAAIYANTLNVVAGSNSIDYASLNATPIAGSGAVPGVSIDVAQLGGMYANRITLVGNEYGLGVANAGMIAAQAGDLTLTTSGQLVQSGKVNASGNVSINAAGIANTGTIYAQQSTAIGTAGALTNSGTVAAQQNTSVSAGSIASAGTLGAGVTGDGSVGNSGDLTLSASGQLDATGLNVAGGNATLSGSGVNLAGSETAVNGNLSLTANAGDVNLAGATTSAGGAVNAQATGAIVNDHGTLTAGSDVTLNAGSLSNRGGEISSQGTLVAGTSGQIANQGGSLVSDGAMRVSGGDIANNQGIIQSAAALSVSGASLDNSAGRITSLNGDGLSVTTTGTLTNSAGTTANGAQGGVIGGAGAVSLQTGDLVNHGAISAQTGLTVDSRSVDNSAGGYLGGDNVTLQSQGAINNQLGTIESNHALTISGDSMANDAGSIKSLGTDALKITTTNALTNTANGLIGGNGEVSIQTGSADNSNGSLLAADSLSVQSNGEFDNAVGLVQSNGDLTLAAHGAILNGGGQIGANGATSSLQVSGSSIDNSDGRIVNLGTGATTINGGASITNTNASGQAGTGTIGGNGDVTLTTQTLTNTQGAQTVAGHDLTLNVSNSTNNNAGVLSAAHNLTLNGATAVLLNQNGAIHANGALSLQSTTIDNTSGKIGNDAGSGGSISIQTGAVSNGAGAIGSDQDLSLTTGTLTGDGSIVAGRNGSVTLASDYTQTATSTLHANGDLTFTTSGKLTNQGTVDANGTLTVNAANVENQSGADLNSANTTVNAQNGAIDNAGRIEGDAVTTNSTTLSNTGTVIGGTVTANANTINNTGTAAVLAAANRLNLYAANQLSNTDGANLFSVGDINIAANDQRDANGLLANRTQTVLNDQSTIEAQGNVELTADTFTNTRPAPTISTETTSTSTTHETKRQKYSACATANADPNGGCSQAMWVNGYKTPLTSSYSASQVVSETSGPNATDRVLIVNVNGQQQTIYYNTLTTNVDGSVTVNYWDAYDPHVNYAPDTEYASRSDGHNGYQRVEIWRDTTSTVQQDKVTSQAQQAQLVAGGSITLANVGTINNNYSAISAGQSIQIGSTQQSDSVGSGSYGGTTVNNVGQTLYQYQTENIVSTYAWNEDTTQDRGTIVEPSVVHTPVAIGGTGGTIVANQAVSISGQDVNNQNVAAQDSATGATGGTLGSNGNQQPVSGSPVSAPQSVANATGALSITLPTNGMYSIHSAPDQAYLVVTDPRLTSYTNFISSDYMLGQLNLNPQSIEKRLGDGMYEQQMVRNQVTQLTGRTFLPGYDSAEDEYRALMTNGVNSAQAFGLVPGVALSAAQMDALTSDIVWLVDQTVTLPDGSTTHVLAPVVYMAHSHADDLQPSGAYIAADDVNIHAVGTATNSGVIKGGTNTVLTATDILNRGGSISSSGTNGTTVVSATNDVVNASGTISGNRVAVIAGRDLVNTTLVDVAGVSGTSGVSKANQTLIGQQGAISATGDLSAQAGRDLTLSGANLSAGGDALVTAGRDITVDTVQSTTNQSMSLNDQHHWEESKTTNVTSGITAGGSVGMQSGNDTTLKGATVSAGKDLTVLAGGNLTATTVTDTAKLDNVAADSNTRKETDHNYDEHAVGTQFTAGGNATLAAASTDASKGNVMLTGSSVTAGMTNGVDNGAGAANIVATGNVTINEAREEHDAYQSVQVNRGSVVSSTKTDSMTHTHANVGVGSTVSGDTVNIQSGHDLTVQGSTVVGTSDVSLAAANNVNITTSKDTVTQDSYYHETHSGIGTSGLSVSIGTQKKTDTDHAESVVNNGSTIGSLNGNLNVKAGDTLHVTGSDLIAGKNLSGVASNIVIDSATDTNNKTHSETTSSSGVTLGLSGSIGDAINGAYQQGKALASGNSDGRASALHAIAAGGDAAMAGYGAKQLAGGATGPNAPSIGVQVSVGSSKSRSQSSEDQTSQRGSNVQAGGTAAFVATGDGTPGSGNLSIAGSNVNANDVLLAAQNQINIVNTTDTDSTRSSNSSSSASVGVSVGTNGIGISASMQNAHGDGNSDAAIQNASHVGGANSVTVVSGGDTNIIGSQVSGGQVAANVGGNLNIQSVQDVTNSAAHQSSAGGGFSISQTGSSASFSSSHGDASGNYAGVNEQAGIQAGDGGFNVTVKGNTDLTGAAIASTADSSKNSLTTGTLTYSDIENHSSYNADSSGFSAGAGVGDTGKVIGPGSVSGSGGVTPMIAQSDSGSENATTRSGVSAGTINITNPDGQTQDVASLNRDTSNLNGTVSKTPDVRHLLDKQADTMNAAQAAGQTISQGIGAYADMKRDQAISDARAAAASGDTNALAAALDTADAWKEGGANRAMLHTAGGALIGGLGGSSALNGALGGAAGAGLSSLLVDQAKQISNGVGDATGSSLVGNIVANIASGLGGALVGGSAGAAAASNVDLYNHGQDKNENEAQKEIADLRKELDKERAMIGQVDLTQRLQDGLSVVPGTSVTGALGGGKSDAAGKAIATNNEPLRLGSTGRTVANSLNEQLAMKEVMSDPAAGTVVPMRGAMTDSRWPGSEGWVKMTQNVNGVEIHYVRNTNTGAVDDFKFK